MAALEWVRGLYEYHRWANRRLFDHALQQGADVVERYLGREWSRPSIRLLFAHIYGADAVWLARWHGRSLASIPGDELASMAALRAQWDTLEAEQQAFVEALSEADVGQVIRYKSLSGAPQQAPLWQLLQHVPNHATHHRSEIATMLTRVVGSPPDTGVNSFVGAAGRGAR